MSFAFKRFSFFGQHDVPGHGFPADAACAVAGGGRVFVGCDGALHVLDEGLQAVAVVPAYGHKLLHLAWAEVRQNQYLVAVGVEEPGASTAAIKVWERSKLAALKPPPPSPAATAAATATAGPAAPGAPASPPAAPAAATVALAPLRVQKVFNSKYPEAEPTALAVTDAAAPALTVAVGLGSGMVYLFQGDLSKGAKLHHTAKLSARPERGDLWAVTALFFPPPSGAAAAAAATPAGGPTAPNNSLFHRAASPHEDPSAAAAAVQSKALAAAAAAAAAERERESLWLFAATESQTLAFNVADGSKNILDQAGVANGACAVARGPLLVVAREDALYDYTADTRAGCTVFDGPKQWLSVFQRYLILVTADGGASGGAGGAGGAGGGASSLLEPVGGGGGGSGGGGGGGSTLHILDVRNKLVAGSFPLGPGGVAQVLCVGGQVVAATRSGRLLALREVELTAQLNGCAVHAAVRSCGCTHAALTRP
ncbi:subunit of VPS-C complex [Monoraphidium neglectum]|uniref:Subunit of VPS-C complex n=1 Tax=Monoraphidium neglectum TaxID=145388 RepID=A0A0D2MSQ6_9CHLO|nr:subunit of VPS-C complex [Monoraphidium neglectum]KIZ03467.1 subunit of VPS-C complex [Monoraphidium neglectum]|eukprot:XP_013902486.1 subunit of VPS-C complex [Monoraphidium neglectum]